MMNEPLFMANNSAENLSARLLKQRTILVFGSLDEELSTKVISSLLYLAAEDEDDKSQKQKVYKYIMKMHTSLSF